MNDFAMAEIGIRQLHARFIDAVWRQDATAFANCFTENGEWKIAGRHMHGRAEIGPTFAKMLGVCERVMIIVSTPILQIDRADATSRIFCTELAKMKDGSAAMTLGVYYDRYAQQADQWQFRWRHWTVHYRGPPDLSAQLIAAPDFGPPPGMPGADEPTMVVRKVPE